MSLLQPVSGACLKCKRQGVDVYSVRKDPLCEACVILNVKSRYRRAVDALTLVVHPQARRTSRQKIRLTVALSGGINSCVLVDIVNAHVEYSRGKWSHPTVIMINDHDYRSDLMPGEALADQKRMDALKARYPKIQFLNRSLDDVNLTESTKSLKESLVSLSSQTSIEDIVSQYREKLILDTVRMLAERTSDVDEDLVIFGDSATRLAAKTLSLTSRGRGVTLPFEVGDQVYHKDYGTWSFRPLKSVMNAELELYFYLVFPDLPPSGNTLAHSSGRAASIDILTRRYFTQLEEKFPSLVNTVVRTTGKLVQAPSEEGCASQCDMCHITIKVDARQWLDNITVNEPHGTPFETNWRTVVETREDPVTKASQGQGKLCYGCAVALRGSDEGAQWPKTSGIPLGSNLGMALDAGQLEGRNNTTQEETRGNKIEQLLDQFELKEDNTEE